MPSSLPLPRTVDAWLKQLEGTVLPIAADHHRQLRRTLTDSRSSLRDIAELIQHSPALALSVMREANSRPGGLGEAAESLENALNRLGVKRIEELLSRHPAVPLNDIPKALRQIQLISQHAAQQANGLFAGRLARLWQEVNWSSLLFLSPVWILLARHPQLYETWEQRVLAKGEAATVVERELIGVPLLQLCLAMVERWNLPEWIAQGYRLLRADRRLLVQALHIARHNDHPLQQQQYLDHDDHLRRWLTHPANSVLMANGLAMSAHHAWSGQHSLRWQRLAGLYLQLPLPELQQLIHQQAVQSARLHAQPGLWHPAEALLWPWDEQCFHVATTAAQVPQISQWRQLCAQLLAEPSAFSNVVQLTACACQALQACGLPRTLLLLANRTGSQLMAQQHSGIGATAAGLTLEVSQSQVLQRLMQQPAQLHLTPQNIAQFSALLPGSLKALFPSQHLLVRSLASNGRVVMILFADQAAAPIGENNLKAFGKTVQCIERALTGFARRGR